jgi:hypothetical protein
MRKMRRTGALALAVGGFLSLQAMGAFAGEEHHAKAKSGEPTLIRTFWTCMPGGYPKGETGAHVDYGTVTIKKSTRNRCGAFVGPVLANEIWYTSPPGFKGLDRVMWWPRLASKPPTIIDVDVH